MEFVDYYRILGLEKNASADDIKKAYRKLARELHPDVNPNDTASHKRFQQVNEANEVLSDPVKRKKYDTYGKDWEQGEAFEKARQQNRQYPGGGHYGGQAEEGDFSEFFESLFGGNAGGGRGRSSKRKGQDYNAELRISLEDVFHTHQQTITVNGKNIRITIPAGVEQGQVLKLKGYGAPGINGGPSGDLFISFSINPHLRFKRTGNDLHTSASLELYTAVLGGETTITTIDGKVKLKINPGTQQGHKLKLKGKGLPVYKQEGQSGDLYISFDIKVPTNLSEKEIKLFEELAKLAKS